MLRNERLDLPAEVAYKRDRHREIVIGNRIEVSGLVNNPDLAGRDDAERCEQ